MTKAETPEPRKQTDVVLIERLTRELEGMRQSYRRLQLISDREFGRANAAERERDEARQQRSRADAEMARQMIRAHNAEVEREHVRSQKNERITALEAEAARLREALKPFAQAWEVALKACSTSSLSDFGAVAKNHVEAIRFQRAHAALATKEPGDG
jgi:hypothetical protein